MIYGETLKSTDMLMSWFFQQKTTMKILTCILGIYHADIHYLGANSAISREPQWMAYSFVGLAMILLLSQDGKPNVSFVLNLFPEMMRSPLALSILHKWSTSFISFWHSFENAHHKIYCWKISYCTQSEGARWWLTIVLCSHVSFAHLYFCDFWKGLISGLQTVI